MRIILIETYNQIHMYIIKMLNPEYAFFVIVHFGLMACDFDIIGYGIIKSLR